MTHTHLTQFNKVRAQSCPVCHALLNAASHFTEAAYPKPGDYTVCCNCKSVLIFGDAMDLRLATQQEIDEMGEELTSVIENLAKSAYSLFDTPNGPAILHHKCGHSSSNPNDVKHRYCGFCHQFLE